MDMSGIGMPSTKELIIVLVVMVFLFGAKKLPQLAKAIGQSIGLFKKGLTDLGEETKKLEKELQG
jgi:sec-independent protein translocase protein TatA